MFNFVMPALTALGINSGVNLLRRKPLFQNAGTAAVTGGVLGGFNGGGLFSSSPTASAVPTTSGAFEASMGLGNAYNAGAAAGAIFDLAGDGLEVNDSGLKRYGWPAVAGGAAFGMFPFGTPATIKMFGKLAPTATRLGGVLPKLKKPKTEESK